MSIARYPIRFLSIALFYFVPIIAGASGLSTRLEGVILDESTGLPIQHVAVEVDDGEYVCFTNFSGYYSFDHLPLGEWIITVSRLGYRTERGKRVSIVEDITQVINFRLAPLPVVLPEQRVVGQRRDGDLFQRAGAVITGEEIEKAGFKDIIEALASLPGVTVNAGYSPSGNQQITLRGETGKRLAVVIDGMPLADGVRGEADLSVVPLGAVERIEVHRGGEWGDAALGGVVEINTRKIFPTRRMVSGGSGTFSCWDFAAMFSHSWGATAGYLVTGEMTGRGDEYTFVNDAGNDSTRSNTARRVKKLFAKTGGKLGRAWDWGVSGLFYENHRGAPGPLHESTPEARLAERRRIFTAGLSSGGGGAFAVSLQSSISDFRSHYSNPLTFKSHSQFDEMVYRMDAAVDFRPFAGSLWAGLVGVELSFRDLNGINYLVPQRSFGSIDRTAGAAWVKSGLQSPKGLPVWLGAGRVTGGLRYDRDGQTPEFWAPRVGVMWGWGRSGVLNLSAGWGRSFRRPLLTSLFWKEDAFSRGNPDLEPERSREWDAGIEIAPPKTGLVAGMRFFDRSYDGFIEWERRLGGHWVPVNLPRAMIIGREDNISFSSRDDRIRIEFFHTLMWPTNQAPDRNYAGKLLLFRPKHSYQFKLSGEFYDWQVRIDARWVDRRYTRKQNTKWLPPYRWFDLSLRRRFQWNGVQINLSLKGGNLTNEPVCLLERYPLPGRSWRLGIECTF